MKTYKDYPQYPSVNGWYCLIQMVTNFKGETEAEFGSILKLDDGAWYDEEGDEVTSIYDPMLGCRTSMDSADFYVPQS